MFWCSTCSAYFPVRPAHPGGVIAPVPPRALPDGALGELFRRVRMEAGDIPPPPGTRRIERRYSISLRGTSINRMPPGTLKFSRAKEDLQGRLMRAQHELHELLPRPIPSVGETGRLNRHGKPTGPVFGWARLQCNTPAGRDLDNFGTLVIKAWGDGLVGPKWKGQPTKGQKRIPANGIMLYNGRAYHGGWMLDDGPRHWITWFDFAPHLGDPTLTLSLTWDEPLDAGTAY